MSTTIERAANTPTTALPKAFTRIAAAMVLTISIALSSIGLGTASAAGPYRVFRTMQECEAWAALENALPWNLVTGYHYRCVPGNANTAWAYDGYTQA